MVPADDRVLLLARYHRARLLTYLTRLDDAETELKRTDEAAGRIAQSDPEVGVWASFGRMNLLRFRQRFEEMLPYSEAVERFQLQFDPADTAMLYKFRIDRAGTYQRVNRYADSEKLLRELVATHTDSPDLNPVDRATATLLLGQAADFQGRSAEAVPLIESAIQTFSQVVDKEDYRVLSAQMVLAETELRLGRFEDSTTLNQTVYEGFRKRYGDDHQVTLIALGNCGINQYFGGRHAQALSLLMRSRDGLAAQFGPQGPPVQYVDFYVAESLLALGRGREAVPIVAGLDEAALMTATPGDHWDLRLPALKARLLLAEGHLDQGRQQLAAAIRLMEAAGIAEWHVKAARIELARSR